MQSEPQTDPFRIFRDFFENGYKMFEKTNPEANYRDSGYFGGFVGFDKPTNISGGFVFLDNPTGQEYFTLVPWPVRRGPLPMVAK